MSFFDQAIEVVLKHEGGFVDDPTDPGGATNFGISLRFLKSTGDLTGDFDHDGDVDYDDIKAMTRDDAVAVYKKDFWDKYDYDQIQNYEIAARVFDMCVNMGSKQAAKLVQRAATQCGHALTDDGVLGPHSFTAINSIDPDHLLGEIRLQHVLFYLALIAEKPQFEKYRMGWLRRACS